jgi:hypothetical protein
VHPRLALGIARRGGRFVVRAGDRVEPAGDVAGHVELRMHDEVHVALLPGQLHDHGVDEERHVVGDHLDDGVAAGRPAVLGQGRREDMEAGRPLGARLGGAVVRDQRAVQLLRGAVHQVVGGDVPVVGAEQRPDLVLGRSPGPVTPLGEGDRLVQQVVLLGVDGQVGRH